MKKSIRLVLIVLAILGLVASPVFAADSYTVKSGDVFWKIAKDNGMTTQDLAKLNPQVKDVNKIFVGNKLNLAAGGAIAAGGAVYHGSASVPVYRASKNQLSFTVTSALFDKDGKIVDLQWDVIEMDNKHFPAWHDPSLDAVGIKAFADGVAAWKTKKELKADYGMAKAAVSKKEWDQQNAYYEEFFEGKTAAEVEAWLTKYTDVNGRPYKLAYPEKITTDTDKATVAKFTDAEKKMLVDVTTNATMSLKDDHSNFILSLNKAWANKQEIK